MKKILLILMFLFIANIYSNGMYLIDVGAHYTRQISMSGFDGINEFGLDIDFSVRLFDNTSFEIFLMPGFYDIEYNTGVTYTYRSLNYGFGVRLFLFDGFYVRLLGGGFYSVRSSSEGSKVYNNEWTLGGGAGYIIPFPWVSFVKPFVAFTYHKYLTSRINNVSFGGGAIFIF